MTMRARVLLLSLLALTAIVLPGCQTPRLEGVVIPGPLGVVAVIDRDDTRLDQVGIPDAHVRVSLTGNGRTLVDTTTDEEGRFSVPTSGDQMARGTVRVIVEADGYARIDKTVPLRSFYRSLYITMVQRSDATRSDTASPDADSETSG
ncbi:MAG: carboxypeptidase-like regulatory domain-containing protein [Phycisphaerales bacterium]